MAGTQATIAFVLGALVACAVPVGVASPLGAELIVPEPPGPIFPETLTQVGLTVLLRCTDEDLKPNTETRVSFHPIVSREWNISFHPQVVRGYLDSSRCQDSNYSVPYGVQVSVSPNKTAPAFETQVIRLRAVVEKIPFGYPVQRQGAVESEVRVAADQILDIEVVTPGLYQQAGTAGDTLSFPLVFVNNGNGDASVETRIVADPINNATRYVTGTQRVIVGPGTFVGAHDPVHRALIEFHVPTTVPTDDFFRFEVVADVSNQASEPPFKTVRVPVEVALSASTASHNVPFVNGAASLIALLASATFVPFRKRE